MIKSSDLQNDLDRLNKCFSGIEAEIAQLEVAQKPNCTQIVEKEKAKYELLSLIEALEKKLQEVRAKEGAQPVSVVQQKKQEEFDLKNGSYAIVGGSYLGSGDF